MKICITSQGETVDSQIDPRFGRCAWFIFMETDGGSFRAVANPNKEASGGAGIQSGQLVAQKEAKIVITGNVGPNASQTLQAAGIKCITGASGTVKDVVEQYKQGTLSPADKD